MQKIKRIILLICFVVFFYKALIFLFLQTKHDYGVFKKFSGLSDDQKRELLIGDLYKLIHKSSENIPEESHILLLTDNANEGLYLSYHLYPRKLFFNNRNPIRELPPNIDELDRKWLENKKIEWIIFRFSKKYNLNKIVKIDDGKTLEHINSDKQ